jgi:hypothetical protein
MSFRHPSEVHKHLFAKHPLFSHRMVEDNAHTTIVEPVQDTGGFVFEDIESGFISG